MMKNALNDGVLFESLSGLNLTLNTFFKVINKKMSKMDRFIIVEID